MGTISEKLTYLDETRENIRQSINSIGGNLTNSDTFRSYSDAIDEIYEKFPKVEGEGSNITLENTMEASIKSELNGDTSQDGTPTPSSPQPINVVSGRQEVSVVGKNLYNYDNNTDYSPYYLDSDGGWINGNSNTINQRIGITSKTISIYIGSKSGNAYIRLGQFKSDGTFINRILINQSTNNITLNNDCSYIWLSTNKDSTNYFTNVSVVYGTSVSSYEEYKGQSYEINLGKNLFNKANITSIINGTIENDVITSNAISSDYDGVGANITNFKLQTGTYYVSMKVKLESGTVRNNLNTITISSSPSITKTIISNPNISNEYQIYSASIVCSSETSITNIGIQLKNQNSNAVISYTDIMISKDSNTTYAPYKTPIELCKINTYKDMIFRSKGVNLNNSEMEIGSIDNSTGENVNNNNCIRTIDYIPVQPNTQYTISNTMNYNCLVHEYAQDKSYIQYDGNYNTPRTFTTTSNTYYIRIRSAAGNVQNNLNAKYQLQLGNQVLPYEPYNAKDKWLLHKEIGKVVLDGSESWKSIPTNTTGKDRFYTTIISSSILKPSSTSTLPDLLCNRYIPKTVNQTYTCNTGVSVDGYGNVIIYDENKATGSANDYKTWVSTHNTIVYYVLATPTTTEITDSELISQLAEFGDAKSYEGTTNINVDGDLPIILNVKALEDIFSQ